MDQQENSGSAEKRKWELVEEKSDVPPVGTHHGGNFHVYMNHKIQKLQELHQRPSEEILTSIFAQCCIYVNGATNPSLQDIRKLVTIHGGEFAAYKVSRVTHIVCDYLTDAQLKQELGKTKIYSMSNHRKIHIVQAKWIVDSISRNVRLPESDYLPNGLKGRYGGNLRNMLQLSSSVANPKYNKDIHDLPVLHASIVGNSKNNASSSSPSTMIESSLASTAKSLLKEDVDVILLLTPNDRDASHQETIQNDKSVEEDVFLSNLTYDQREFLAAAPTELRKDIIAQLIMEEQLRIKKCQDLVLISNTPDDNDTCLAAVVQHSHVDNGLSEVIDLASPFVQACGDSKSPTSFQEIKSLSSPGDDTVDIWKEDELLHTLQQVINFIHCSTESSKVQKQKMQQWISSLLDQATCPVLQSPNNTNSNSKGEETNCFDEEQVHWHLRRCWRLLQMYASWLIGQELFSYLELMKFLLEQNRWCSWTIDDENNGLWSKVFIPSRYHNIELKRWSSFVEETLAIKGVSLQK